MSRDYQALVVRKSADKSFSHAVETLSVDALPAGEVLIRVRYSGVNFKDCLSVQGNPAITRRFPHTPGIDAAGEVVESSHADFSPGDKVMVISRAMGMSLPGGFGQYVRVPAAWVTRLPDGLDARAAMVLGTPGLTAALAVAALARVLPDLKDAEVAVSGATGGVGCLAVALLAARGCKVSAISGKAQAQAFLTAIGASEILSRDQVVDASGRNLLPPRWSAAVDVAGGAMLSALIRQMRDGGAVAVTGNAGDTAFDANVLPFILRGVKLLGINTETVPADQIAALWRHLAGPGKPACLDRLHQVVALADLPVLLGRIMDGEILGRVVVDLA
ncbi:MAG: YhdH/YhfP family quinone oxidoreductase [Magnetospirillum sp.]